MLSRRNHLVPPLITVLSLVSGQFSVPPPAGLAGNYTGNANFQIGLSLPITYSADPPGQWNVDLWQQGNSAFESLYANVTGGDGVTNVWVVNTTQDLSNSNVFFLSVISVDRTNTGFNSHYFNITNGARASQITMQSNPSQSSTTQSASMQPQAMIMTTRLASTITIMPLSSNPTSSPSIAAGVTSPAMPNSIEGDKSNNNDGLSRRAVIGLGAGLGSGALVLIATTVAFCLYRRRKNGSNQIQTSTMEDTTRYSTLQVDNFKNADLPGQRGWAPSEMTADRWRDPAEMEAKSTILEMPAH